MSKNKIFVITQPQVVNVVGGAITIFFDLCNLLSANNYEVTGICYSKEDGCPTKLNKNVNFVNLYNSQSVDFSGALHEYLQENVPDLFIFFFPEWYSNANLDATYDNIPRILMQHSRPDWYYSFLNLNRFSSRYKNTVSTILFPSFYKLLPDIIKNSRVVCIPNYCVVEEASITANKTNNKIAYLSRIDELKGLEFLIESFARIAKKYPNWTIDIWGQAEPKEYIQKLQKLVQKKKIDNQFFFRGITDKPSEILKEYDFAVFPSYFEGFSLGLGETLGAGLPCVGLKKASGVNETIIDGYNGFLCEDKPKEFASKIELLINNEELRKTMSANAISSIKKYSFENFSTKWLDLVARVINNEEIETIRDSEYKHEVFSLRKIKSIPKRSFIFKLCSFFKKVKNRLSKCLLH